jgi:hypothetical protein
MTIYTVECRNDTARAYTDIEANTPDEALEIAKNLTMRDLDFERYDVTKDITEITVIDEHGDDLASWADDHLSVQLAAHDLLDALTDLVERDRAAAAESGFTDDEMSWLEDARRAIAKAKGGAP